MGSDKKSESGTTVVNQTTTPTPTAEETRFNQLNLQQQEAINPAQTQMMQNAFGLGNQLLTSFGNKEGDMWKALIGGVTNAQQQGMISEQDRLLRPEFQRQGIYDSGMAATARMRSATDLANQNAQFNVGALQNALNLALTGQAQVQQPALGASSQLGAQLAGLRSTNQSGTTSSNSTQTSMNPFLKSFQSSLGSSLGAMPAKALGTMKFFGG